MHMFFGLIIACLAIAVHGLPTTHVVGGKDAAPGKYPYQVSLRSSGTHFCGGSIIGKRTILTAAHCIINKDDASSIARLTVHAGTNLLSQDGNVYKVAKVIYHEMYDPYMKTNDIGLLILTSDIEYTTLVQPISLAITDIAPAGYPCILTGWGRTSFGGKIPDKLQELDSYVYDHKKCKRIFLIVTSSHICAYVNRGKGACHGDSGGPLVADGTQIGIVSFGQPCAVGSPDVYTKVSSFKDWLERYVVD